MTVRAISRALLSLAGAAGLALLCWSYGALGPVWLLPGLPGCG